MVRGAAPFLVGFPYLACRSCRLHRLIRNTLLASDPDPRNRRGAECSQSSGSGACSARSATWPLRAPASFSGSVSARPSEPLPAEGASAALRLGRAWRRLHARPKNGRACHHPTANGNKMPNCVTVHEAGPRAGTAMFGRSLKCAEARLRDRCRQPPQNRNLENWLQDREMLPPGVFTSTGTLIA